MSWGRREGARPSSASARAFPAGAPSDDTNNIETQNQKEAREESTYPQRKQVCLRLNVQSSQRKQRMLWDARLSVRVGLGVRLYDGVDRPVPKIMGMPSRIPSLKEEVIASRRGNGILESGPARLCKMSWLDRRFILALVGVFGVYVCDDKDSTGEGGGEYMDEVVGSRGAR